MTTLAPTLQAFFTDRLARQRQASPNTVAAYRDALKLLLAFAAQHTGKEPSHLEITDLDAPLIGAFLDHLETERGNGVRTRNARLAAVHALFRFRRPATPRPRRRHPASPGNPAQAFRPPAGHLPHRTRGHRPSRRPGHHHLDRPPRHRPAGPDRSDRPAGLRTDRVDLLRHPPGHRSARQLPGQGPQTTDHPADLDHHRGHQRLALRAPRPAHRPAVPQPVRHRHEPRRPGTTTGQVQRDRSPHRTDPGRKENLAPRPKTHLRDAPARSRRRQHRHRALAGSLFRGPETVTGCLFRDLRAVSLSDLLPTVRHMDICAAHRRPRFS